jgi:hypothetical protein
MNIYFLQKSIIRLMGGAGSMDLYRLTVYNRQADKDYLFG